jgi:iron complex transport system ATP-binding protein
MSDTILSFQNVTFGFRQHKTPVLRDVSFSLYPGRVTAILGPNGAGKTTLLNLALGWLHPWEGEIQLQGKPLPRHTRKETGRLLALVPQSEHTPFDYSVFEYVLMGRSPHLPPLGIPRDIDYQETWKALEQVGLAELTDQPVPQLSGGERQLMLLARAVTQNPRLFLLDEPTALLTYGTKPV